MWHATSAQCYLQHHEECDGFINSLVKCECVCHKVNERAR